ncbi:Uncharacterised protein [Gordonia terrae]|nr:Uncharacterised protein [Clostridioides difficile]VTS55725.1 Uncharacterised protein [Gordonia terrae]
MGLSLSLLTPQGAGWDRRQRSSHLSICGLAAVVAYERTPALPLSMYQDGVTTRRMSRPASSREMLSVMS